MNIAHYYRIIYPVISLIVLGLVFMATPSHAQNHSGYCDDAQSTADFQSCIKSHNEAAKEELNKVYKELLSQQDREDDSAVLQAQKQWIEYRDSQCTYEAGLTDNDALKHLYETSCQTALTQFRAKYLSDIKNRSDQSLPREFSNQPRWVNILTNSYPKVYWRYGEWISVDLDCDGEKEDIMTGLDVSNVKNSDRSLHSTLVIAVADTPETGKPKATIHSIPVRPELENPEQAQSEQGDENTEKKEESIHLCNANVDMAIISHESIKEQSETEQAQSCGTVLQINDSTCKPLQLYKKDADYALEFFSPSAGEEIKRSIPKADKKSKEITDIKNNVEVIEVDEE